MGIVSVGEVARGKALTRFLDLPQALHGEDPRFAPPVQAWERYRVARRNPYFERGDATLFTASEDGRDVGRIAAHVSGSPADRGGEGRFGLWATVDDERVAGELVAAAAGWLREQACTAMSGPWSLTGDDEPGALVAGDGAPGTTGRPWRPVWEADRLVGALGPDVAVLEEVRTWRLRAVDDGTASAATKDPLPGQAGSYGDRRLVLDGIAAVPDVSALLRGSGLGSAWSLARRIRQADWDVCTVVRCDGDPAERVPRLVGAAGRAGYSWVVAPWSPDRDAPPETVHRRYRVAL
jgi:hypothetical protein